MRSKWIICCGPDWYRPSVSSTEQLIKRFHEDGYRVLWINPIAFRSPFLTSSNKKSAWKKIRDKLRTHWRIIRRVRFAYWVWVPFYLPLFTPLFNALNKIMFNVQFVLIRAIFNIHIGESILWSAPSSTSTYLQLQKFRIVVYEAHDLMSDFRTDSDALKQKLRIIERDICLYSDIVIAPTEKIMKKLETLVPEKESLLLHHGVDFNHFSTSRVFSDGICKIIEEERPVAGYFGSLSDANDKEVFKILALNGFSVVLIGRVIGDYSDIAELPGIYIIGPIDYEELPTWAQGFDVGLLNWRMHEWIENCFPVKSLEYLALGIPIVSAPIPVLQQHYSDEILFAESPEEFLDKCRYAVANDNSNRRKRRQESVRNYGWEKKYAIIKEYIDELES